METTQQGEALPAFDLSLFEAAETGTLEVLDMRGDPLLYNGQPVTIELYGPGSSVYAKAQAKTEQASQARVFAAMRGGKAAKDSADETRRANIEKLVACTKAINNFPIAGGAQTLYENRKLGYITNQVSGFLEDWGRFLSPAAKSSPSSQGS